MQDYKFFVRSSNIDFTERQRSLFDSLNEAEKQKNDRQASANTSSTNIEYFNEEVEMDTSGDRPSLKRKRSQTIKFRGKESIFKKPVSLPPRFKERDIPDHQRNPHKWVKYTLGDVSPAELTNRSNTAAALSFLQEMEERKQNQTGDDCKDEIKKIIFKPSTKSDTSAPAIVDLPHAERKEEGTAPVFRSSKVIMPEYVVGMDKKTKKVKRLQACNKASEGTKKEITLQHLLDEED